MKSAEFSIKTNWIYAFCLLWLALKIPFILFPDKPLNGDVAVHLLMALEWFKGGASKFMWGQEYLGTLETLWNALWFKILSPSMPYLWLSNLCLSLLCDLLFLRCALPFLKREASFFIFFLLLFSPFLLIEFQIYPSYSYTVVGILVFSSFLVPYNFLRGFLLGMAFYVQPISLYFIFPIFLYFIVFRKGWDFLKISLGFLIPFLFTVLPWLGPGLDWEIIRGGDGKRQVKRALEFISSYFLNLLGLSSRSVLLDPPLPLFLSALGVEGLLLFFLAKNEIFSWKKFKSLRDSNPLFYWTMLLGLFLIPTLFILRRSILDDPAKRYLWLWHYPVYFFASYLLGHFFSKPLKIYKISVGVFLALFLYHYLTPLYFLRKKNDPNEGFSQALKYLQDKDIQGIVGDYWAVYPVSFLSYASDHAIKAYPLYDALVRKSSWALPISMMPRIAYLCTSGDHWCELKPPSRIKIALNNFAKDKTEPEWKFSKEENEIVIQIYELDF